MAAALRVLYSAIAVFIGVGVFAFGYSHGLDQAPKVTPSAPPVSNSVGPVACSADGQEDGQLVNCKDFKPLNWNGEAWYTK